MTRTLALAALLLPITAAFAQDAGKIDQGKALAQIKEEVEAGMKQYYVPGASLAIIKDDKVVLLTGLGYKDLKNKKPVTPDTLFAIGSTSKAFTSMIMAMAVDEGKVKWTDSPKKYLPYFRMSDPDTDAKITINDIMSHRSGLPRTDFIMLGTNLTSADLIWNVTRAKPTAKLGAKWQYQNIMFVAAGEIEKTLYGKPWQELVKERIFDPLGMTHTNTSVPQMLQDADHSLGYDASPQMNELPMRAIDSAAPAGAINSSARDMAEWIRFLLRRGTLPGDGSQSTGGKRLVSQENFDEIFKPHQPIGGTVSYGYGWMLDTWNGHKIEQHGGNIDGFNAQVAMMPDQNLGMVLLTNVSGSPLGTMAMESVWKNFVGAPVSSDKIVALKDADQEVGKYTIDAIKLDLDVTHEGDKLFVLPAGQPKMELLALGDRKYKLAPPAPDKIYVTFSPDKDDPKLTQGLLEQSGQKFVMKHAKPYRAPISVDELIAKETLAMGGAENMAKIKTLTYRYVFDMETQGLSASSRVVREAPNKLGEVTVYSTKSGERMAWDLSSFDGEHGAIESSYSPRQVLAGSQLATLGVISTTWQELNWKKTFQTAAITGEDKVDGQDVYVLEKRAKSGTKVTDYISKTTFTLLKRAYGDGQNLVTDTYKEYKPIDGVQFPVTIIRDGVTTGKGTVTISDVQVNQPVDEGLIRVRG
jgi:CubicO group peptidase (beta-lactamase class C family)